MRDVLERLERLGVRYYVTGSEALPRYGEPRQTMAIDIVLDAASEDLLLAKLSWSEGIAELNCATAAT